MHLGIYRFIAISAATLLAATHPGCSGESGIHPRPPIGTSTTPDDPRHPGDDTTTSPVDPNVPSDPDMPNQPQEDQPIPNITIRANSGMAPFTVHVHGLDSSVVHGDKLSARYQWDFGDTTASSQYNKLEGWNAAHIYDQPGTYTITLKITNEIGGYQTRQVEVQIAPDARQKLYVSAEGNDGNSGLSESSPVKTINKALQLAGNNYAILFRKGDTFTTAQNNFIDEKNVVIGSYGTASAKPLISWSGPNGDASNPVYSDMFITTANSEAVVIQDLAFSSPYENPTNADARALGINGTNITVRNCFFDNVSYAMTAAGDVYGWLTMGNVATVIGAYFIWAEGTDHVHLNNTVDGSDSEHNIRIGGADRMLIHDNTLTNTNKTTIWLMLGTHAYVSNNSMHYGRLYCGPNPYSGGQSDRFRWAVIENNHLKEINTDGGINMMSGAEHVMVRNNIINRNYEAAVSIWGYYAPMNRNCSDIRVFNNTGINNGDHGKFLKLGSGSEDIRIANNLFVSPTLIFNKYGATNCDVDGSSFSDLIQVKDNLWQIPAGFMGANSNCRHRVGGVNSTAAQWDAYPNTDGEKYGNEELLNNFAPADSSLAYDSCSPVPGVFTDFYGNTRPTNLGEWTAGAVQ